MVVAWPAADIEHGVAVGMQGSGGMATAMTRNLNGNGNTGMTGAVATTNGGNRLAC